MEKSPPSAGKTLVISGSVALAVQDLLNTVGHDVWGLTWMTPSVSSNIMIIATAIAGLVMHTQQRSKENAQANIEKLPNPPLAAGN